MNRALIAALTQAQVEHRSIAFAMRLTDGAEYLLPDPSAPPALNEAGQSALAHGTTGTQVVEGAPWFIEARTPPPRLILIGAVHIAQALAPFAGLAGFEVTVIDPRRAFATAERFPGTACLTEWPDTALERLAPDSGTAIAALTHDPKLDDPALDCALRSPAFYIGALGSRKTHAARLERLRALGHGPGDLARIHGPIGLDIAAVTPAEIALSVIAEIVAVRRGGLAVRPS
jgi:xanthine dehydrogenase accessory factor